MTTINTDYDGKYVTLYARLILLDSNGSNSNALIQDNGLMYITFEHQQFKWREKEERRSTICGSCGTYSEEVIYKIDDFANPCNGTFPFPVAYIRASKNLIVETNELKAVVTESIADQINQRNIDITKPSYERPANQNKSYYGTGRNG
jgi:hypothetical protein